MALTESGKLSRGLCCADEGSKMFRQRKGQSPVNEMKGGMQQRRETSPKRKCVWLSDIGCLVLETHSMNQLRNQTGSLGTNKSWVDG